MKAADHGLVSQGPTQENDSRCTYLSLTTKRRQGVAQVEGFLEATNCLALRRDGVTAVDIAIVVVGNLLGALLARSLALLGLVTATRRAAAGELVFLSLQLSGQAGIGILQRRCALGLLLCRLGRRGRIRFSIVGNAVGPFM